MSENYNPLLEEVEVKDYQKVVVNEKDRMDRVPEPVFAQPTFGNEKVAAEAPKAATDTKSTKPPVANPELNELDQAEKRKASAVMADAILDGYGKLKSAGGKLCQIPTNKFNALVSAGEINPNQLVPVTTDGQMATIGEYVGAYNSTVAETLVVTDEFRKEAKPVLTRVLMKRNIGMTDEQLLAYLFGADIISTGATIMALRQQAGMILNSFRENKAETQETATASPSTPSTPSTPPTPPAEESQPDLAPPWPTREYTEPEETFNQPREQTIDVDHADLSGVGAPVAAQMVVEDIVPEVVDPISVGTPVEEGTAETPVYRTRKKSRGRNPK